MTPQKQLYRHDPENGVYGDCFRTAIACLLDLAPTDVPHVHEHNGALDMAAQDRAMNEFLAGRGLTQIAVNWSGELPLERVLEYVGVNHVAGLHFMLTGQSRTGCNHVVIANSGGIVWDPSLTDAGIIGPCDDGNWWVTFLGALV